MLFAMVLAAAVLVPAARASAAPIVPVTVTISRVTALQDPDPGPGQGDADMYSKVAIDGFPVQQSGEQTDKTDAEPFWTFTRNVDAALSPILITIDIWDADTALAAPDDEIDMNPVDGKTRLNVLLDVNTGNYSFGGDPIANNATAAQGDGDTEHTGIFEGGEQGKIQFAISTLSASGDADGDGLLDTWETKGLDADGNGSIDVNLPAMGANPFHKDLFLEQDWETGQTPSRASIQAVKDAFRAAPLTNPDGVNGVNLWVDMGNLVDTNAREGQAGGTCRDGIDNRGDGTADGADTDCGYLDANVEDPLPGNCTDNVSNDADGLVDQNDPDCLVGDNLGGGSAVNITGACNLDAAFYAAKAVNFNPLRRWVFRYGVSLNLESTCPSSGGWGEIGGNDFMEFNHDGGSLMHEFGHTLGLRHGGFEDNNCKPDYVSVMNYDDQFGIGRQGGGTILDFSPPRDTLSGSDRGVAPLPTLKENGLNDGFVLDGSDASNRYVFVNPAGAKVNANLNQGANWNSDVDPPPETGQTINIDTNATGGGPARCANASNNDSLEGFNDWNAISLPFRQFGDSASGAINPEKDPEPTLAELLGVHQALNTTDLSITKTDSPDPVIAGRQLTYTLTVTNKGPNPATSVHVVDPLPADVSFASASAGCTAAAGVVTCNGGDLAALGARTFTVTVNVPADLVYRNGGPKTLSNTATVSNLAGPDSNPANNAASATTKVVAVADVRVNSVAPTAPPEVVIGEATPASVNVGIENLGPSSPIDTILSVTTTATAGASATPSTPSITANALAVGVPRTVTQPFTLKCTTPGVKTIAFSYTIALAHAADTDPVLTNNTRTATTTLECLTPVAFNIRPGSVRNDVNLAAGVLPTVVVTSNAGEYGLPIAFDASSIIVSSVRFGVRPLVFGGGGTSEIDGRQHLIRSFGKDEELPDLDRDLLLHFDPRLAGITLSDTSACVKGRYLGPGGINFGFFGCDTIYVVPNSHS